MNPPNQFLCRRKIGMVLYTNVSALPINKFYFDLIPVYDALTGEIVKTLKEQSDCVRDVSWHPYLNEIVGSSW